MEANFSCSLCSNLAVQCCLCSTPRTYLCQACTGLHTSSKRICHSLLPASTPTYVTQDNLTEHNRKTTALKKLGGQLEVACAQLIEERRALDQIFNEVYTQQVKRLYDACCTVHADISGYYERLQADAEAFKRDLVDAEQSPYISSSTRNYIQAGFHVPPSCVFFDILGEMNRRIQVTAMDNQLTAQNCLLEVVSKWRGSPCSCVDCCEIKKILACSPQDPNLYWHCQMCSYQSNLGVACDYCGFSNKPQPIALARSASQHSDTHPRWICPQCQYSYNFHDQCMICGYQETSALAARAQSSAEPYNSFRRSESLNPNEIAQMSNTNLCWACPQCKYEYNIQSTCTRCHYARAVIAPVSASQVGLQHGTMKANPNWTCLRCGYAVNTAKICYKCGSQPEGHIAESYASQPEKPTAWNCLKCGYKNTQASTAYNAGRKGIRDCLKMSDSARIGVTGLYY